MVRRKKCRKIFLETGYKYFKPQKVPLSKLDYLEIGIDEFEAIRLANIEKLSQNEAEKMMGIPQATFSRLLSGARKKISTCIIEGKPLRIHMPSIKIEKQIAVKETDDR